MALAIETAQTFHYDLVRRGKHATDLTRYNCCLAVIQTVGVVAVKSEVSHKNLLRSGGISVLGPLVVCVIMNRFRGFRDPL